MPLGLGSGLGRPMLKRTASMCCSSDDPEPRSPKRPDFDTDKYFRSELPQEVNYPALPPLASFQPIHTTPALQPLQPLQAVPEFSLEAEEKEVPAVQSLVKSHPVQRRRRVPPIPTDCYQYYYGGRDTPFTIPKHTVIVPEGLVLSMLRRLGSESDRRW
jgi:hypothetical protein